MRFYSFGAVCVLALAGSVTAQTLIDLRTQTKSVDFSAASSTKPSQVGTTLPATCAVGQTFLNTRSQPGQNLYICTAANVWTVQGGGGAGAPNYSSSFSSSTTVTVLGTTHKLGTANLIVDTYDNSNPARLVEPDSIWINPITYDVVVNFAQPQSGMLVINATGGGGGGNITSVFGRTGVVTAQSGDYSFAQISGSVAGTQLPAAGGDVSGTLGNATVTGLRNRTVSAAAPAAGQALAWDAGTAQWEPQTISGGAGLASQLGDFQVTRTSSTVLTIGANCSVATPCNVRVGGVVYGLTTAPSVTLSGGTGAAYIYIDSTGNLKVGHNLTLSCSTGCAAVSGVTAFPSNVIPLFQWTAANNTWANSGTDQRAFLSTKVLAAGPGIITAESGSQTQVSVDSAAVPTFLTSTASLDFFSLPNLTCAEMTLPLSGAVLGDAVEPGWPAGLEAGLIGTMRVSANGVITVRLCNLSGAAVDPASATYRATIVRSF
ncbi:MAG: hypothetical protein JO323_04180 [Acidobacteriia bacterium]|nr:hypothetical protein [Terriglobia bacterium]